MRLIDPNGYTVPGTVTDVTDTDEAQVRDRLLNDVAPQHASEWADFGYDARDYRVA